MKEIILDEDTHTIMLSAVNEHDPIFAKFNGKLIGMVVKEDAGWILRIGGHAGATGYHASLKGCLQSCSDYAGYKFYVQITKCQ